MMVNFAGKKLHWIDKSRGEVHDCEILEADTPTQYNIYCGSLPELPAVKLLFDRIDLW